MKKLLISFAVALGFGLVGIASAQPAPVLNPFTATQGTYVDTNFHSVPYAIAAPNNGLTTVIFDPSTSQTDIDNAFGHLKKALSNAQTGGSPLVTQVLAGVVNTNIQEQVTRVVVPFSVTSSTTLQTIPFSVATNLETGGHYKFEANLYVVTGTGGTKIDVGGTSSTSNFVAEYQCFATTTLLYGGQLTSYLSGPTGSATGTATLIKIVGEVDVGNGGTFVIQFAQYSSNATASTVLAGSTLTVVQIP